MVVRNEFYPRLTTYTWCANAKSLFKAQKSPG